MCEIWTTRKTHAFLVCVTRLTDFPVGLGKRMKYKSHRSLPTTRFAFGHHKSVRVCSPNGIRSRAWLRISQERNVRRFSCAVRVTRTDHDTCALPSFAISSHIRRMHHIRQIYAT